MEIRWTERAADDLRRLPRETQKRIADKMRFYGAQGDPLKFAKRLTDFRDAEFRFRVGDYRIFFDVVHGVIFVLKIAPRDKSY